MGAFNAATWGIVVGRETRRLEAAALADKWVAEIFDALADGDPLPSDTPPDKAVRALELLWGALECNQQSKK